MWVAVVVVWWVEDELFGVGGEIRTFGLRALEIARK